MVELELLAIAWACKKAAPFLEGIDFKIFTDHKPLIPILNDYALSDIENKRLQRLKMKLQGFRFEAHHIAGKMNIEADAFSCAPANQQQRRMKLMKKNSPHSKLLPKYSSNSTFSPMKTSTTHLRSAATHWKPTWSIYSRKKSGLLEKLMKNTAN